MTKGKFIYLVSVAFILFYSGTSCEGPAGPEGPPGPEGPQGPAGPAGEEGNDGNANVTLYIFDGYDFSSVPNYTDRFIELDSEQEMRESAWLYYLVLLNEDPLYYSVPGFGAFGGEYLVGRQWTSSASRHVINCVAGGCGEYGEIHIIRIEGTNVVNNRSKQAAPIIPEDLDVSDYESVKEYYGIQE